MREPLEAITEVKRLESKGDYHLVHIKYWDAKMEKILDELLSFVLVEGFDDRKIRTLPCDDPPTQTQIDQKQQLVGSITKTMKLIHEFQEWLKGADPEGHQEVYELYKTVKDCSSVGNYNISPAKGTTDGWILSAAHLDAGLRLASNKAREAFLSHIRMPIVTATQISSLGTPTKIR